MVARAATRSAVVVRDLALNLLLDRHCLAAGAEVTLDTNHSRREKQKIRGLLMNYLKTRPGAVDTLEGIAMFWLTRQRIETQIPLLVAVLTDLVEEGLLEVAGKGDKRRYRLKANRTL